LVSKLCAETRCGETISPPFSQVKKFFLGTRETRLEMSQATSFPGPVG
jgi:hypothetical protein